MKKPPSSSIGTIPEEGIAIASLEHGGWQRYVKASDVAEHESLSIGRERIVGLMKCFRNEVCVQIVLLLEEQPGQGAGELVDALQRKNIEVSQPDVSHHLSLLRINSMASSITFGKRKPHTLSQQCHSFLTIIRSIHSEETINELSKVNTIAGLIVDEMRVKILQILERESLNVTTMYKKLGESQPAVSHHLAIMLKQDVLSMEKRGKSNVYSLRDCARSYLRAIAELEALVRG